MQPLVTLYRRALLFVGIVWRDYHGVRIAPWTALKVVRIIFPSRRHKEGV